VAYDERLRTFVI